LHLRARKLQYATNLFVQIARFESQVPHLGKVEKVVQEILQTLAFALHDFDLAQGPPVARRFRIAEVLCQQLHVQPDRRERILDLVSQAPRELSDLGVLIDQFLIDLGGRRLARIAHAGSSESKSLTQPKTNAR